MLIDLLLYAPEHSNLPAQVVLDSVKFFAENKMTGMLQSLKAVSVTVVHEDLSTSEPEFDKDLALEGKWKTDEYGFAEGPLNWNMATNLRWLALQKELPEYMPCGSLTGEFLAQCARQLTQNAEELNTLRNNNSI